MKRALVLCTGNSCRSIMAEALINQLCYGTYQAESAGSMPADYVHPRAIDTLKRHGIQIDEPRSKSWDEFAREHFNVIITVCDQAANESCPAFPGAPLKLHWSTPDPAQTRGSDREIMQAFEDAFHTLKARIQQELQ